MLKIDPVKAVKIGATVLSVLGMLGATWASDKEQAKALEKLAKDSTK